MNKAAIRPPKVESRLLTLQEIEIVGGGTLEEEHVAHYSRSDGVSGDWGSSDGYGGGGIYGQERYDSHSTQLEPVNISAASASPPTPAQVTSTLGSGLSLLAGSAGLLIFATNPAVAGVAFIGIAGSALNTVASPGMGGTSNDSDYGSYNGYNTMGDYGGGS